MTSVRLPVLALLAFLLPALTGCDDGTTPGDGDLGDLDAAALVTALNELVAPLEASSAANANLRDAVEDLTDVGVQWRPVDTDVPGRVRHHGSFRALASSLAMDASLPPLPVTFPPEVVGRTFVFDFEAQQWEADEARTGAPSNGVRLVWYSVDGSGRIRFPLEERGFIDLTPGTGDGEAMVVTVVETGEAGSLTLLDFLQNRDSTDDDAETDWFTAAGFYADDSRASDFDIASEETVAAGTDDATYDLEVALENEGTRYTMVLDGSQTGASGAYDDRLTATVVRGGASTTLEVVFQGTDTSQEEASGTLVRNGTLLANINIDGSTFEFTTPDGGSFSGSQANALNALFTGMTRAGFQVLLNLPLVLP